MAVVIEKSQAAGGRGISPFKKRGVGKPRNCLVLIGVYPGLCNFGNASIFASPTIRQVTGRFWGCECYRDVATVTGSKTRKRASASWRELRCAGPILHYSEKLCVSQFSGVVALAVRSKPLIFEEKCDGSSV